MSEDLDSDLDEDQDVDEELHDADEELDEAEDHELTVEHAKKLIAGIPKYLPDVVLEVNGQMLTGAEMVAQLQAFVDSAAKIEEARLKLEEAERAAHKSGEELEATLRTYHAQNGSLKN
jgi:phosphoglucomutase